MLCVRDGKQCVQCCVYVSRSVYMRKYQLIVVCVSYNKNASVCHHQVYGHPANTRTCHDDDSTGWSVWCGVCNKYQKQKLKTSVQCHNVYQPVNVIDGRCISAVVYFFVCCGRQCCHLVLQKRTVSLCAVSKGHDAYTSSGTGKWWTWLIIVVVHCCPGNPT